MLCHPEQSTTASIASRRAQSKDPYNASDHRKVSGNSPRERAYSEPLDVPQTRLTKNGSFDYPSAFALAPLRMTT